MEFKKLELEPEHKGLKKILKSENAKRTLLYAGIGAAVSFALFYFSEGQMQDSIVFKDIAKSMGIGAAFGLFIANSPCARGRC